MVAIGVALCKPLLTSSNHLQRHYAIDTQLIRNCYTSVTSVTIVQPIATQVQPLATHCNPSSTICNNLQPLCNQWQPIATIGTPLQSIATLLQNL